MRSTPQDRERFLESLRKLAEVTHGLLETIGEHAESTRWFVEAWAMKSATRAAAGAIESFERVGASLNDAIPREMSGFVAEQCESATLEEIRAAAKDQRVGHFRKQDARQLHCREKRSESARARMRKTRERKGSQ